MPLLSIVSSPVDPDPQWHHSGRSGSPFCEPTGAFSDHRHDPRSIFGSGNEQTIGLSPHLLQIDSLCAIEGLENTKKGFNPRHDLVREGSVPVKQLMEEILWPQKQQETCQQEQQHKQQSQKALQPTTRDDHTSINPQHDSTFKGSVIPQPSVGPSNGKRRRGRPKLYPATTDAHKSDVALDNTPGSREFQLEKNRVAAERCRQRRKKDTARLVANFSVLSSRKEELKIQESALREELLNLKNQVLSHARCNSSLIGEYIAKTAGSQLVDAVALKHTQSRRDSVQDPAQETSPVQPNDVSRQTNADQEPQAIFDPVGPSSHAAIDAYDFFKLIRNFMDNEDK